jgi:hypothetical protein
MLLRSDAFFVISSISPLWAACYPAPQDYSRPPALGECSHGSLAGLGIPVRRRTAFMVGHYERPHPRASYGRGVGFEYAPHNGAIAKHIEIVVIPFSGGSASRRALEEQADRPIPYAADRWPTVSDRLAVPNRCRSLAGTALASLKHSCASCRYFSALLDTTFARKEGQTHQTLLSF